MRTLCSVVLIAMSASMALAQPAPPDPQQSPPPQQGYPPPQQYPQGPQGYPPQGYPPQGYPQQQYPQQYPQYPQQQPMQVQLTVDEQWLLDRGYISEGEHIGGGVAALFLGFGIGQAVQGRWSDKGWIFTVGESVAIVGMFYGLSEMFDCGYDAYDNYNNECEDRGAGIMVASVLALGVFRVWEIVDAFAAPPAHNRKVRQVRARLGMPVPLYSRVTPFVAPSRDRDGGYAGVSLRF